MPRRRSHQSTNTRWAVSFHTDPSNGPSTDGAVLADPRFGWVTGVSTNKAFGNASGSFEVTFKKNEKMGPRSALRIWRDPEDVWMRVICIVDGTQVEVFLGLIDAIKENTQRAGGGQRIETYTITGRDIGKCFEQTTLFTNLLHPSGWTLPRTFDVMNSGAQRARGTPAHFIRAILEIWFGNNGGSETQWMLPEGLGGGSFFGALSAAGIQEMTQTEHGSAFTTQLKNAQQSTGLWAMMEDLCNPLMNELYVDLGDPAAIRGGTPPPLTGLRPTVFLRERPFPTRSVYGNVTSRARWDRLVTHAIDLEDVNSRSIAIGGSAHRFNYWQIAGLGLTSEQIDASSFNTPGPQGPGRPGAMPIWSDDSIARHGLRRYVAESRFIPIEERSDVFLRMAANWLKKVHDWYVVAPYELSGQITCSRVFPEIRIGQRVLERRAEGNIMYYVEGVAHSQAYPGPGRTVLTLTRGEYEEDDLLAYVYDLYEFPRANLPAENCFFADGGDFGARLTEEEFGEFFDESCNFIATPPVSRASITDPSSGRRTAAVDEGAFTVQNSNGRELEIESDGTVPREGSAEAPMSFELSDVDPAIGTRDEAPSIDAPTDTRPGDYSALDRAALERGAPIDTGGE